MKFYTFIFVCLYTLAGYSMGFDDTGHSLEDIRRENEALHQTMLYRAQTQRTWKAVYNRIQTLIAPKALVMPAELKRNFDLNFVEWLAETLKDKPTGDLIEFTNCWHGWGMEIVVRHKWTKVCLKYDKMENEYRDADRQMYLEYMDAIQEKF